MLQCVYLDDQHPLKLLCTLELAAHERASQGLLPNRRRTRGARLGMKSVCDSDYDSSASSTPSVTATRLHFDLGPRIATY